LDSVVVVTGHQAGAVEDALAGLPIQTLRNPGYREGQSRGLVAGVRAIEDSASAAIIGVADQPGLDGAIVRELVELYRLTQARLVAPRYAGIRGNPVLFDRSLFGELLEVKGDVGGRPVIARHAGEIAWLDVLDSRIGQDIDTGNDYERMLDQELKA
jgi:molybdenum cofactor cytidylyltransferase